MPTVARTQDRFDGFQQRVAGGCHLNREVSTACSSDAGFAIEEIDNFYLKGSPKAWGYMYVGRARKA